MSPGTEVFLFFSNDHPWPWSLSVLDTQENQVSELAGAGWREVLHFPAVLPWSLGRNVHLGGEPAGLSGIQLGQPSWQGLSSTT